MLTDQKLDGVFTLTDIVLDNIDENCRNLFSDDRYPSPAFFAQCASLCYLSFGDFGSDDTLHTDLYLLVLGDIQL